MQNSSLLALLNKEIPISLEMRVSLPKVSTDLVVLMLPLAQNKNHKGTLFGGSLYSGCALACYALFLSGLQHQGFTTKDIVIGDGQIRYLRPVTQDAQVTATWPSEQEKIQFFETLRTKGKARINMKAVIEEKGQVACEFTGRFVAIQSSQTL